MAQHYLADVRDQYESYPYPHRNPEDEKKRLLTTFSDVLALINQHCFEGTQTFENNFRVLVAGGGTGDGTIYLADQLKHTNAEIVHLDISDASLAIAQERARIRGLKNITFLHESLLDVASLGLGEFDYINCSGVLHHLESPQAGLSALKSVLKDSGAMSLMLYAPYGRTGIYMMQNLMRIIAGHIPSMQMKVDIAKTVLDALPQQGIYSSMRQMTAQEIANEKDAGIYDLFLHSQDRPFSVAEIYELLDNAGMHLLEFLFVGGIGKSLYNPLSHVRDEKLKSIIEQKSARQKHIIAELLMGNLAVHSFFCAKTPRAKPDPSNFDLVPYYNPILGDGFGKKIAQSFKNVFGDNQVIFTHNGAIQTYVSMAGKRFVGEILAGITGSQTIRAIGESIAESHAVDIQDVTADWLYTYNSLNLHDWLLLKA